MIIDVHLVQEDLHPIRKNNISYLNEQSLLTN